MSELTKTYDPSGIEQKWYSFWLDKKIFASTPDHRESYSIVIPPPNVTGVLHMGHMLNNTIQDILARRARMLGKNVCWVPGTDHASIATEAKVVQKLRKDGIKKSDLSREDFLAHAWEWKEKHGGIILEQLKKLGASCDWDRTSFTMDPDYYEAVIKVFVDFHKKGYIYRGLRMINWDCEAKTALSNEEVIYNEDGETAALYSVRYAIKDSNEYITIATVRPETIMGDTAIAVNPSDERYQHLIGKKAIVPFVGREIEIIADDYVEKDFGTGCLKVTPAHDINDYEIGQRHNLEVIDVLNDDGTMSDACGIPELIGVDRFVARKRVVEMLKTSGDLVSVSEMTTRIGRSERTNTIIEPRLSLQWFIKMKDISSRALQAVENEEINLHPSKFKNTYRHWMENVRDWCISRQLWWGHRIPAWYTADGDYFVAENEEKAFELAKTKYPTITKSELTQDSDVLDTWASSWLWPIEVFKGFGDFEPGSPELLKANKELAYYYPTAVLVTAPEILFFWVARMIIAGYEYMDEKPFSDVYLHGIVRDKQGKKMSKSLGNSPDPFDLISKFSADGVRIGMLFSAPAGNDLLFDEGLCEQGRNFANKMWNAFRLVKSWTVDSTLEQPASARFAHDWFTAQLARTVEQINDDFSKFRISDALKNTYRLFWDDFCSWYLEMIKPEYGKPIDSQTLSQAVAFFDQLLAVLHPFMPFITEELWHNAKESRDDKSLSLESWPTLESPDSVVLSQFAVLDSVITAIRSIRSELNISPSVFVKCVIDASDEQTAIWMENQSDLFKKLARVEPLSAKVKHEKPAKSASAVAGQQTIYVPLEGVIDLDAENARIDKEIQRLNGFLKSIIGKLSNARFVESAPEDVVVRERQKQHDTQETLKKLELVKAELNS